MAERDDKGRFVKGNAIARQGGRASRAALSPERRSAIARLGLEAVAAELGLTPEQAAKWLSERGIAALRRMRAEGG
jgi:hypothetical protein